MKLTEVRKIKELPTWGRLKNAGHHEVSRWKTGTDNRPIWQTFGVGTLSLCY
jgi:hypothetical protein